MSQSLTSIGDIKTEFMVRMSVATTVAFYTDAIVNNWIDEAHKMAAGYHKWPMTEGRVSTTFASLVTNEDSLLTGVYPEGWKARSIRMLTVGGKNYEKKSFMGFTKFLQTFPQSTDKIFTDYGLTYYINAGAQGSGTVAIFGQYTPNLDLTDPTASTVFSGIDEDGNQAIVEFMMFLALTREKTPTIVMKGRMVSAAFQHQQAGYAILDQLWKRFTDEAFAYQSPDNDGMWKRIDIVGGGLRDDLFKRDQFT